MSFHTFPASLPYIESLHDQAKLDAEIQALSSPIDLSELKVADKEKEGSGHPFVDALHGMGNLQRTTNNALAHKSTEDACLDLYYQLGVSTDTELVFGLLDKSWKQDPITTLRIIWHTRSIHRGKSANDRFYVAFGWLLKHHPQTAIRNVHLLAVDAVRVDEKPKTQAAGDDWDMVEQARLKSHGYWKDLLNVCMIYAQDEFVTGPTGECAKFKALNCPRQERRPWNGYEDHRHLSHQFYERIKKLSADEQVAERAKRQAAVVEKQRKQHEEQQAVKRTKRTERHARIQNLLANDPVYRSLHFTVARLFATQLQADLGTLKAASANSKKYVDGLSLAGKWAPTLAHSHDKHTLLATSISELLFPPTVYQNDGETREHYVNKVRELYRKEYLSPLRKALDVAERRMSLNQWSSIDFSHVPSKCMQNNMARFVIHDKQRYVEFLKDVAMGKKSVSGATLQPHELAERARCATTNSLPPSASAAAKKFATPEAVAELAKIEKDLVNAQWKTLVESIRQDTGGDSATLGSCIAVCDMSGSMMGKVSSPIVPLWGAVGLSIILAEFAASPFDGSIITFADDPTVVKFDPAAPFTDKIDAMFSAPVGYSTNFLSVFVDLLLPMAKRYKLKQEDMVKRLYVFSDMEFNEGYGTSQWETTYEEIKKAYDQAGYTIPELVWWNLAGARPGDVWIYSSDAEDEAPIPVTKDVKGCSMLCGYSAAMLKSFLEGSQIEEPEEQQESSTAHKNLDDKGLDSLAQMRKDVNHESFKDLVVVD